MEDHFFVANGTALTTVVDNTMRHTGVFTQHLRCAFEDGACERVDDLDCLTDFTHLVEGAVHEAPARAAAYKGRARADSVPRLPVVLWAVQTGLVGRKDQLALRVDLAAMSVADAQVQAVVVLTAPRIVRARPDDGRLQLLVQAGVEGKVGLVAAPTPREAHTGAVAPAPEQRTVHENQRIDGLPAPTIAHWW